VFLDGIMTNTTLCPKLNSICTVWLLIWLFFFSQNIESFNHRDKQNLPQIWLMCCWMLLFFLTKIHSRKLQNSCFVILWKRNVWKVMTYFLQDNEVREPLTQTNMELFWKERKQLLLLWIKLQWHRQTLNNNKIKPPIEDKGKYKQQ